MNVRISYGIDIGKIPDLIQDRLGEIDFMGIAQLRDMSNELISTDNPAMAIELIDQARHKVAEADRLLQDATMILRGYVGALETEETSAAPVPPTGDENVD